jgi:hypothetical protein
MASEALKSAAITGYDTVPPTKPAGGAGAVNGLYQLDGYVTRTAGVTTGSVYRLCRVRSDCYVKNIDLEWAAAGANAAFSVGLYYSDAPASGVLDGTQPSLTGVVNSKSALFASAIDPTSAGSFVNETNQSGNYPMSLREEPLWQAAGLTTDPGGYFDIAVTTGGTDTNGGNLAMRVSYQTV